MKKLLILSLFFFLSALTANSAALKAVSMSNFTTADSGAYIKIYVAEDFYLHSKFLIPEGSVLAGEVVNIKNPKRLKRDADFDFIVYYYMDDKHNKYKIEKPLSGNFSKATDIDKKKMLKSAAIAITSHFIPGFSYAIHAYEGAKNSAHHKFRGAIVNVYEHSILSYIEKGTHLRIKKNDCFYIKFPAYNQEEYNYETLLTSIDNYGNPTVEYRIDGTRKNASSVEGANLAPNYPIKHQYGKRVFYLARPKKEKSE